MSAVIPQEGEDINIDMNSTWPVPIVKPGEDGDKARRKKLAKGTNGLAMRYVTMVVT